MNIQGKIVLLRAIEKNDLSDFHKWANDPNTQDIIGDIHAPSSYDFHIEWYERQKNDLLNQRYSIVAPEVGLIGMSTIIKIDWRNRHAWHGIYLGDKDIRGKGYGIDAVMATMRYAFEELNLERLDGSMIEYNEISINFYCNKLGWKIEGQKENYYFRKGKYYRQIIVGITKAEYTKHVSKTKYWEI